MHRWLPGACALAVTTALAVGPAASTYAAPAPVAVAPTGVTQSMPGIGSVTVPTGVFIPGDTFTVRGALEPKAARIPRTVLIQELTVVGWKKIASGKTGKGGVFAVSAKVKNIPLKGTYRVSMPETKVKGSTVTAGAIVFPSFTITPQTQTLGLSVPDITTPRGKGAATASATPAKAGEALALQIHTTDGKWKTVGKGVTKADGTVAIPVTAMTNDVATFRLTTGSLNKALPMFSPLVQATMGTGSTVTNDTDHDGLINGEEGAYGTSPTNPDTDGDGIMDADEVRVTNTNPTRTDTDGDGLSDGLEIEAKLDPNFADTDADGLSDKTEIYRPGLSPRLADVDTDFDGLYDGEERYYGSSPKFTDTDADGVDDYAEVMGGTNPLRSPENTDTDEDRIVDDEEDLWGTDPFNADSDADGLLDGEEIKNRTDPTNPDSDGDDLGDYLEVGIFGTDPNNTDSDGGGALDGQEADAYLDPMKNSDDFTDGDGDGLLSIDEPPFGSDPRLKDTDNDHLRDDVELTYGTDPTKADTDGDGIIDGEEVYTYSTDPLGEDTDGDGVSDGAEVKAGTNPKDPSEGDPATTDTDGDGLSNAEEADLKTNHRSTDTDSDGLTDYAEVRQYNTDPTKSDSDGDKLNDGPEVSQYGTDPAVPDTDGDGLKDGVEVNTKLTDPLNVDTDGDGFGDGEEVNLYRTEPTRADSDLDGVGDAIEIPATPIGPDNIDLSPRDAYSWTAGSVSKKTRATTAVVNDASYLDSIDTDSDGLVDYQEVNYYTDVNDPDTDDDSLSDGSEALTYHTHPRLADSDKDGLGDVAEVGPTKLGLYQVDLDPLDDFSWALPFNKRNEAVAFPVNDKDYLDKVDRNNNKTYDFYDVVPPGPNADTDGDGLKDVDENRLGTDPTKPDTDGDTLSDGMEVNSYGTDPKSTDSDSDGLGDQVEVGPNTLGPLNVDLDPLKAYSWAIPAGKEAAAQAAGVNDKTYLNAVDTDGEKLADYAEVIAGTNKSAIDTDGDQVNDYDEVITYGTDPLKVDTDGDGLADKLEVGTALIKPGGTTGTGGIDLDPKDVYSWAVPSNKRAAAVTANVTDKDYYDNKDTDADGLPDYAEVLNGTDKTKADTDGDGLTDGAEVNTYLTNPKMADTDGDGLTDGYEVNTSKTDPNNADGDGDGLSDGVEVNTTTTDPKKADTDGDGLNDGAEVNVYTTNPKLADTDGDTLSDGIEVNTYTTNPKLADTDGDTLNDNIEAGPTTYGPLNVDLDPKDAYSWAVPSGKRSLALAANVNDAAYKNLTDTDGEGVKDYLEVTYGTDKTKADTDGDTLNDNIEVGTTALGALNVDLDPLDVYSWAIPSNKKTQATAATVNDAAYYNNTDTDAEGLLDYREALVGTTKTLADTDGDLVNDKIEVDTDLTDPLDFLDRKHLWSAITVGTDHTCGIDTGSKLYCWGRNNNGQLGIGSTANSTRPYPVQQAWNWTKVAAGNGFTCAIRSTGALYCWGLNANGQLGIGSTTNQTAPTQVGTATTWTLIDAGATHACGIQGNNTQIQCWGLNANGQLGNNTTTQATAPVGGVYTNVVQLSLTASAFSVGSTHTCAVSGGTMYCTGLNTNGQVGDNTNTQRQQFTTTSTTGWTTVSASSNTSCGVKSPGASGTLWCWGANANSQVGDGTAADRKVPTQIATGITGWSSVDVGTTSACAIRSAGSLYCWGQNANGQFGNGTTTAATTPTQIGTVTTWSSLSVGAVNSCAIRTDNSLYCWGDNTYGQVGNNTTTASTTPVNIK